MNLSAYLSRIGVNTPIRTDLETLRTLHRAHVETIPFEDLDVLFGTPTTRAPDHAFGKLVTRKRGGWCYEMNGLFAWALEEIGFSVRRLAGGVAREFMGDDAVGNHLMLIVELDGALCLADVGFGDGLVEPVPLKAGPFVNAAMSCELIELGGGWWRYRNDPRGSAPSYDFHLDMADEALLEARCQWLQTSAQSPFAQNAVVQRWSGDEHLCLRGRVMQRTTSSRKHRELVSTAEDYVRLLRDEFGLDAPEAASLWPAICARHEEVFAAAAD